MSNYKAAFQALAADMGAVTALLGIDGHPGIDPVLQAITALGLATQDARAESARLSAALAETLVQLEAERGRNATRTAPDLPPLNDDLIDILGRPNFHCIRIAQLFRMAGRDIKTKAENEQAAVIHFLLGHYLAKPASWSANADAALKAMAASVREARAAITTDEESIDRDRKQGGGAS